MHLNAPYKKVIFYNLELLVHDITGYFFCNINPKWKQRSKVKKIWTETTTMGFFNQINQIDVSFNGRLSE